MRAKPCDHVWRHHSTRDQYVIDCCGRCGAFGVYNDSGYMLFEHAEDPVGQIRRSKVKTP